MRSYRIKKRETRYVYDLQWNFQNRALKLSWWNIRNLQNWNFQCPLISKKAVDSYQLMLRDRSSETSAQQLRQHRQSRVDSNWRGIDARRWRLQLAAECGVASTALGGGRRCSSRRVESLGGGGGSAGTSGGGFRVVDETETGIKCRWTGVHVSASDESARHQKGFLQHCTTSGAIAVYHIH